MSNIANASLRSATSSSDKFLFDILIIVMWSKTIRTYRYWYCYCYCVYATVLIIVLVLYSTSLELRNAACSTSGRQERALIQYNRTVSWFQHDKTKHYRRSIWNRRYTRNTRKYNSPVQSAQNKNNESLFFALEFEKNQKCLKFQTF